MTHGNSIKENRGEIIKNDYATSELPGDINEFPFSKFAHEHFQVRELFILGTTLLWYRFFHVYCFHYVHHLQITNNKHFDTFKGVLSDFDFDVGFFLFCLNHHHRRYHHHHHRHRHHHHHHHHHHL